MKILFLALIALLTPQLSFATAAQVNNVVQFGGSVNSANPSLTVPESKLPVLVTLSAQDTSSTNGNYYHFMLWGNNAGQFQVPPGQTLRVTSVTIVSDTASGPSGVLGYASAPFTNNNATVPTGAGYYGKVSTKPLKSNPSAYVANTYNLPVTFTSSTYPFFQSGQGATDFSVLMTGELTTP